MSKYRNKQKQKVAKVFKQGEPKFDYTSKCCGMPATKKACSKGNGEPDDKGFFQSPLGTWNCSGCHKKCSVNRSKRAEKSSDTPAADPHASDCSVWVKEPCGCVTGSKP